MVSAYHKCTLIHMVSVSFLNIQKARHDSSHHTLACDNHKIDRTHCITPSQVGCLIRGITT